MSNISPDQPDFDFWEFVSCSKCRMPFSMENGTATIPFWLTECGHVICNSHLNPDQSCTQCGSQGIQLTPLQREMEAPMSEWFQSISLGLDSIAYAAKFQQEIMASQVRYHRSRHQQLRQFLDRLKREVAELKNANNVLRHENDQYRLRMGHQDDTQKTPNNLNSNGKRQIVSNRQLEHDNKRPRIHSSPRSVATPGGPGRLTLHPGQHLPELSSHKQHEQGEQPVSSRPYQQYPQQRPISTQSLEQYAYIPQESSTFHPPHLSHIQSAPRFFHRTDKPQNDAAEQNQKLIHSSNQFSVPPPSSSRFKPATNSSVPFTSNPARSLPAAQKPKMGPPPTPQHPHNDGPTQSNNGGNGQGPSHRKAYNRALPPPSRRQTAVPATPILGQHPSGASPRRFFQTGQSSSMPFVSSSRGASRPSIANLSTGGQRTPFIPHVGQQGGFF